MPLHPDFKDLLAVFAARKVDYLVVGGYAVGFHALCVNKLANPVYGGSSCATTLARFVRQSGMGPRIASVGPRSSTL